MQDESTQSTVPSATGSDPASMLSTLFSDPTMLSKIGAVLGAFQNSQSAPPPPKTEPAATATDIGIIQTDGLSKLLADPAMLEKLPQIISVMKPLLGAPAATSATTSTEASLAVSAPAHSRTEDRDHLLLAIKPFLSSGRRDAVDTILRLEKLGDFLKQMK